MHDKTGLLPLLRRARLQRDLLGHEKLVRLRDALHHHEVPGGSADDILGIFVHRCAFGEDEGDFMNEVTDLSLQWNPIVEGFRQDKTQLAGIRESLARVMTNFLYPRVPDLRSDSGSLPARLVLHYDDARVG